VAAAIARPLVEVNPMLVRVFVTILATAWLTAASAIAQPASSARATFESLAWTAADGPIVVRTTWSARDAAGHRTSTVDVVRAPAHARETSLARIHTGPPVMTASGARDGAVLTVMYNGGASSFVRIAVVKTVPDGRHNAVHVIEAPRTANDGFHPARAVVCPDEQGFTVLWQEDRVTPHVTGTFTAATTEARTYMARVSVAGAFVQRPTVVPIPWAITAIASNGHGYHLAVRFDGSAPNLSRVCLVTLSPTGQPEQHPWWVSAPIAVGETQLVPSTRGMWIVWRNDGIGVLQATLSTSQGTWGTEPPMPEFQGRIVAGESFLALAASDGSIDIARRRGVLPTAP
jgi:hypothetical protein